MPDPLLLIGGNDRSLWANRGDLIGEMLEAGWEVHGALPPEEPVAYPPLHPIPIHRLPMERTGMNPLGDLRSIRALRRLVDELRPRCVLAYNPKPVIHAGLALRSRPEIPYLAIITGRGALERRPGLKGALAYHALAALYRLALRRPDVVLFQNDDDRAFFGPVPGEPPAGGGDPRLRGEPGALPPSPLPDGPPRFLLISKLLIDKGVREFVEAARAVREEVEGCAFRVVGGHDLSLPHALPADEVARWRAEGLVELVGRVDDVRPHLAWCSVLCHPSYAEGTPRAVLEALSTGRAVVTTDAPGAARRWRTGSRASWCPPGRRGPGPGHAPPGPGAGADPSMAQAARERAREVYDVRKVNARILHHLGAHGGPQS
jgi:glycosyltransferase involved in cell wall biosynthesis